MTPAECSTQLLRHHSNPNKGAKVKPQRTMTKTPHNATGLFAALRGLLPGQGSGASGRARAGLLLATLAAVGMLGYVPGVAGAEIFHPFLTGITGEGTPAKNFHPGPLAVDGSNSVSAGDLYVYDETHAVIDKLNAAGEYVCQITGLPGSMGAPPSECDSGNFTRKGVEGGSFAEGGIPQITVDSATGDLYIAKSGAGVVDEFGPEGEYLSQIKGLSYPVAVAVDVASGDVYITQVAERGSGAAKVTRYEPGTATITTFAEGTPAGPFGNLGGLAVDNSAGATAGDVYVGDRGNDVVDKFNKTGGYEGQLSQTPEGPFVEVGGVAVDPSSGDVYVDEYSKDFVAQFSSGGKFLGEINGGETALGSIQPGSVAIAPTGDVYVPEYNGGYAGPVDVFGPGIVVPDVTTGAATASSASATVEGTVNPEEVPLSECSFEYETGESGTQSASCEPTAANVPTSNAEHTVKANLVGLEPGATYRYRLHVANANGANDGSYATFETLPAPSIVSAVAKDLTDESALLEATIDPNGYDTKYRFEYGMSTAYGTSIPVEYEDLGAGTSALTRSVQLTKLEQGKTYHWRVVAINANGTVGVDRTFAYDTSGGGLPDGRAYEMVTPAHKDGALFGALLFGFPTEIASDGSRVISTAIQCFGNAESCIAARGDIGTPQSFTRMSSGWQATALAPPATQFPPYSEEGYNANSGAALFQVSGGPSSSERFLLRQSDGLFTGLGPVSDSSHITHTEDYSHFAWKEGAQAVEHAGAGESAPFLVGVSGGLESTDLLSACGTTLGSQSESGQGVIAADGSIVYFTALGCPSGPPANDLYARVDGEQADAHTVAISRPECGSGSALSEVACRVAPPSDASFVGASEDGSKVFFTSSQQLTNEATGRQGNLYEYDFDNPAGQNLLDVSAGEAPVAGGPRVQGVMAVSADGSHVYFVAQGVLTHSPNGQGQIARDGADNLYVFERESARPAGSLVFIATLPGSNHLLDGTEWNQELNFPYHQANVTPDGRFLVFTSHGRLTPDDTSLSGARQVFRYDAQTGELLRISIGNDGYNDDGNRSASTPCPGVVTDCTEDASIVQPLERPRRDPTMSDNGEYVFFQSPVGLTPQALDDAPIGTENEGLVEDGLGHVYSHNTLYAQNVYEWHEGHVYLISDGRDVSKDHAQAGDCGGALASGGSSSVCLLGTDATGTGAFFTTADQLVPQDTDTELDIYDARIDGGFPAPAASPPCLGEVCHGIPAGTPAAPSAPTATFKGQGNITPAAAVKPKSLTAAQKLADALKACKRDKKKAERKTCEASAHKKYGASKAKKAKKSSHNGRTSR